MCVEQKYACIPTWAVDCETLSIQSNGIWNDKKRREWK